MYIIAVNTTKADKIRRLNEYSHSIGVKAVFVPFTDIVGEAVHSAEEVSQDFLGNAGEKIRVAKNEMLAFIHEDPSLLKANIVSIARKYGFNEADLNMQHVKLIVMSDDSGLEIYGENEDKMAFTEAFYNPDHYDPESPEWLLIQGIKSRAGIYLPDQIFPGTELVHLLGGLGGTANMLRIVNDTATSLGYNTNIQTLEHVSKKLIFRDVCSFQFFGFDFSNLRLSDIASVDPRSSESTFVFDSSKINSATPTVIEDYLLAPGGIQTKAETRSARYNAPEARAIAADALFGRLEEKFPIAASKQGSARATEGNGRYSVGVSPFHKYNGNLHNIITGKLQAASIIPNTPSKNDIDTLMGFEMMIDSSDAFLFLPFENTQENRTKVLLLASYVIVHKILEPEGKAKEAIFWNEEGCYDEFKAIVNAQFDRGSFPDKFDDFLKFCDSKDSTFQALKQARANYRKVDVSREFDYSPTVPTTPIEESGKYNVSLFCSASLEGHFVNKAREFCVELFENDFGVVWGEGDRHMMGAVVEAKEEFDVSQAIKYMKSDGYRRGRAYVAGSTTETIAVTETNSGNGVKGLNHSYRAKNISDRMEYMYKNSHAFMIMEGGVGTTQELLGLLFCKQHQPDWVEGKPILIHETVISENQFMRKQIEYVYGSIEEAKKQGVHVVKTLAEAQNILKDDRAQNYPDLVPTRVVG